MFILYCLSPFPFTHLPANQYTQQGQQPAPATNTTDTHPANTPSSRHGHSSRNTHPAGTDTTTPSSTTPSRDTTKQGRHHQAAPAVEQPAGTTKAAPAPHKYPFYLTYNGLLSPFLTNTNPHTING